MEWFGPRYGAPYEADSEPVPAPLGAACIRCDELIAPGEAGFVHAVGPEHYECMMRSILGGVNHQLGKCTCCGGALPPDPPELTKRAAAIAALAQAQVLAAIADIEAATRKQVLQ